MPLSAPEAIVINTHIWNGTNPQGEKKKKKVGKQHNMKCSVYQAIDLQMQVSKGSLKKWVIKRREMEKLSGWSRENL